MQETGFLPVMLHPKEMVASRLDIVHELGLRLCQRSHLQVVGCPSLSKD